MHNALQQEFPMHDIKSSSYVEIFLFFLNLFICFCKSEGHLILGEGKSDFIENKS